MGCVESSEESTVEEGYPPEVATPPSSPNTSSFNPLSTGVSHDGAAGSQLLRRPLNEVQFEKLDTKKGANKREKSLPTQERENGGFCGEECDDDSAPSAEGVRRNRPFVSKYDGHHPSDTGHEQQGSVYGSTATECTQVYRSAPDEDALGVGTNFCPPSSSTSEEEEGEQDEDSVIIHPPLPRSPSCFSAVSAGESMTHHYNGDGAFPNHDDDDGYSPDDEEIIVVGAAVIDAGCGWDDRSNLLNPLSSPKRSLCIASSTNEATNDFLRASQSFLIKKKVADLHTNVGESAVEEDFGPFTPESSETNDRAQGRTKATFETRLLGYNVSEAPLPAIPTFLSISVSRTTSNVSSSSRASVSAAVSRKTSVGYAEAEPVDPEWWQPYFGPQQHEQKKKMGNSSPSSSHGLQQQPQERSEDEDLLAMILNEEETLFTASNIHEDLPHCSYVETATHLFSSVKSHPILLGQSEYHHQMEAPIIVEWLDTHISALEVCDVDDEEEEENSTCHFLL